MAFFNKDFYADVATNWKGCGALYIFLLTSVAWLISSIFSFIPLAGLMNNKEMAVYLDQLPHMTIQDGKLSIDKPLPYAIKEPASGQILAVFATDRNTDTILPDDPALVITSNAVLARGGPEGSKYTNASGGDAKEGVSTILKFADISSAVPKVEMDSKSLKELIGQLCIWVPVGVFFIAWPAIFLGHLFQLLIYGGIGMAIASGMEKKITFETAMRLAAIAITPCIVITVVLTALVTVVPMLSIISGIWVFASIAVALAYMVMELNAIAPPVQPATAAGLR